MYGIKYLPALVLIFLVSLYKNIDDIKTTIVSIKAKAGFFSVKKNSENNWLEI